MNQRNTIEKGSRGEELVCDRLVQRKFKIIDRNVREKIGEIDIVAMDGDTLCFIEVRTRRDTTYGHPAETITPNKQRHIRRSAEYYLIKNNIAPCPIRFDVATIIWNSMQFDYFENAF